MRVKTTAAGRTPHASYLKRVRAFPLRSIRDDAELAAAQGVLDALLREDLDAGGQEYLDALTDLVETYERAAHPIAPAPPADVLQHLLEANRLTQPALAAEVGIAQSTLSALVTGKRAPTAEHAVLLGKRFNVSPAVFLPRA